MAGDRIRAPWWLKPFLKRSGVVTNGTPDELQGWPAGCRCFASTRSRSVAAMSNSERIRQPWWLKYVNKAMIGLHKLGIGFGGKDPWC